MRDGAIILAAGKGTRMRSQIPKVLHELGGHPLIWYPQKLAENLKLSPVGVVLGHGREQVEEALAQDFAPDSFEVVRQKEQLGTGHAVKLAAKQLAGRADRVFILSGDVPFVSQKTLSALRRAYRSTGGPLAMVSMEPDDPGHYGRVVRDAKRRPVRIVEYKDATKAEREVREVNAGIYLVDLEFLLRATKKLGRKNKSGEMYLTDIVEQAASEGRVGTCRAHPTETHGINSKKDLARAHAAQRAHISDQLMARGVGIIDPDRTYIDPAARIERDAILQPGCHLIGACRVGSGAQIGPGVVLIDSVVGRRANILAYSHIEKSRIDADAIVGPFARLRPKAHVGPAAEVGNFMELKNTRLRQGVKAHHVGYLGDSDIGSRTNVGAGTITCNYDGQKKHPTVIGEGTFIGSNSTLVAPLSIGDGAYVGAGSTVNRDVPSEGLAFGRAKQVNKDGYAPLLRRRLGARKPR